MTAAQAQPGRNIELKARLADPAAARRALADVATARLRVERQVDTYFHVPHGRLKLREIDDRLAQLIWYRRADQAAPRASDYLIVPLAAAEPLKQALARSLGIRAQVDKRREIFLVDNVRVHLDEVAGLGSFVEFEAVLGPQSSDAEGAAQVARLSSLLRVAEADLVDRSYGDLVAGD